MESLRKSISSSIDSIKRSLGELKEITMRVRIAYDTDVFSQYNKYIALEQSDKREDHSKGEKI